MKENNVYEPPKSDVGDRELNPEELTRGGCLTAFLIFMIIANSATTALYLLSPGIVNVISPDASMAWSYILGTGGVLNVVFALLVWNWKKVGVYAFLVMAILVFGINIYLGVPVVNSILGLLGPIILIFLVKPKWRKFN